jgi:hypothetical protein
VSRLVLLDELASTVALAVPASVPSPAGESAEVDGPGPVHHEEDGPGPDEAGDIDREAAELFGAAPPSAPVRTRPAPRKAARSSAKWTPEAGGIELDELRKLIRTLSRNALADHLGVGRSTASGIIREYGEPELAAANGAGR